MKEYERNKQKAERFLQGVSDREKETVPPDTASYGGAGDERRACREGQCVVCQGSRTAGIQLLLSELRD